MWRTGTRLIATLSAVGATVSPSSADACPSCAAAQAVRVWFFDERFWSYFGLVLLPLVILGAMAALAYRVGLPEVSSAPSSERGTDS